MITERDENKILDTLTDLFRDTEAMPSDVIRLMYDAWNESQNERHERGVVDINKALRAIE